MSIFENVFAPAARSLDHGWPIFANLDIFGPFGASQIPEMSVFENVFAPGARSLDHGGPI